MKLTDTLRSHPTTTALVAALGAVVLAVALYLFQPWQLFLDTEVSEELPGVSAVAAEGETDANADAAPVDATVPAEEMGDDEPTEEPMPTGPVALASGEFGDRSHPASGTATAYELEDGSRILRLEDLETDNGPDLFVYLSQAGPDAPAGEYGVEPVNLGRLKGNIGDQNYELPTDVDLSLYSTVAIWCERFDVVFGTAALSPA